MTSAEASYLLCSFGSSSSGLACCNRTDATWSRCWMWSRVLVRCSNSAKLAAQGVVWLHKKPDPGLFRSVFLRAPFPGGTFTCQVPLHYAGTTIHQESDIHCNAFLCIILDLLKFGFPAPFMVISIEASLESLANGSNPNAHSS